jgi:RNA polymerase primary sigma factor
MSWNWLPREHSLDEFVTDDERTRLSELIEEEQELRPDEVYLRNESILRTREALQALPERERAILLRRFGFLDGEEMTLEAIGKLLGLSRERVRQLQKEGERKLRAGLARTGRPL